MVFCPDCGKDVPEGKFCKNCGAFIEDVEDEKIPGIVGNVDEKEAIDDIKDEIIVKNDDKKSEIVPVESENYKFCYNCGNKLSSDFKFCPACGQNLNLPVSKSDKVKTLNGGEKSLLLAIILSIFLPGLGQIYLGLDNKGAIFLIAYIVSAFLILLFIGIILVFVLWIWALIDTITSCNALNRGEEVVDKLL